MSEQRRAPATIVSRIKVSFESDGTKYAAWHYPGTNGACVVMAGGLAMPKEPGTDRFATAFHHAGFSVLAFDYRHLGESEGFPRGVVRVKDQIADWHQSIAFAAKLPGVTASRIAIWGFSLSGGHIFVVAANNPAVAAAIAQTPNADGFAATRNAARHQRLGAPARFSLRAVGDTIRGLAGRSPWVVPLAGSSGTVAVLTTPDCADGDRALNPDNRYPDWTQMVAARSTLPLARYRPGRHAKNVPCPLLVIVANDDQSALAEPAARAAKRAPHGQLARIDGCHYAPFLDGHHHALRIQLEFLERHVGPTSKELR